MLLLPAAPLADDADGFARLSGEHRLPAYRRRQLADDSQRFTRTLLPNVQRAFRQAAAKNRLGGCAPQTSRARVAIAFSRRPPVEAMRRRIAFAALNAPRGGEAAAAHSPIAKTRSGSVEKLVLQRGTIRRDNQ